MYVTELMNNMKTTLLMIASANKALILTVNEYRILQHIQYSIHSDY